MNRTIAGAGLAVLFAFIAAAAQTKPADAPRAKPRDLSAILAPIIKRHDVPGMAAAVVDRDGLVALGVTGVRQRGSDEPVAIDDLFHLGSCTKAMTATMIGTLVDEGKLSWGTTIGEIFGEAVPKMDPQWKDVTLEQLLCHRAGVPADLSADGLWGRLWSHTGTPPEQRMTLVEGVITKLPVSKPGTSYLYANAGFAIAGAMAERVTGTPWEDLMRERLFKPLGMDSAGFGAPGIAAAASAGARAGIDQPRGHRADGTPVQPGPGSDNPAAIGPGGTVHCSIEDWAKFIALHLDAARGERRLLKPETFAKLHEPYPAADDVKYGMGWSMTARDWARLAGSDGAVLTHNGSNTMWFCVTWLAPAPGRDFAVLVACNQGGDKAAKACDEAAWSTIQDYLKNEGEKSATAK